MKAFDGLAMKLRTLTIFRAMLRQSTIKNFCRLLESPDQEPETSALRYTAFTASLYSAGTVDWSKHLLECAQEDDNIYLRLRAKGEKVPVEIEECVQQELAVLEEASRITPRRVQNEIGYIGFLPQWRTDELDFIGRYRTRAERAPVTGTGVFARNRAFLLRKEGLVPVVRPDPMRMADLFGYDEPRQKLERNTLDLIEGRRCANALLYGDAGCGKSSTVKALVNEYWERGLRLIEVDKRHMPLIPSLMDDLAGNPLKFILFIDDLSFSSCDDSFGALKAVLEGSVAARCANVAVYATSNRRHLIRESFSDRQGDEVHLSDTLQELSSLSDRFGLRISFFKPGRDDFLDIVNELARKDGLQIPADALAAAAEQFSLSKGGRSPRAARQLIDQLLSRHQALEK